MQYFLAILFTGFVCTASGQPSAKCKVYQYLGTDSLNQKLVSELTYNPKGQVIAWYYKDYRHGKNIGQNDTKHLNFYEDSLLIVTRVIDEYMGDSSKIIYHYNSSGQKIKEEHFDFKKRIRKGVDKGMGRPGGCVVFDDDFEKERTWGKLGFVKFSYDYRGNVATVIDNRPQGGDGYKHCFTYDKNNRIISDSLFGWGNYLTWTKIFDYTSDGYTATFTWYDADGKPRHFKKWAHEYTPQYTSACKTNERGQVTEEIVTTEKGERVSREITHYNLSGKIEKHTIFDSDGQPEITHIYVYEPGEEITSL